MLNFGLSAPIDVQIQGADINKSYDTGRKLLAAMEKIPGVVDAHIQQVMSYPGLKINVDRQRAIEVGLSQRDVASNMLTGLSSSAGVVAVLLPQPGQWRELFRGGADAAAAGFDRFRS